MIDVDNCARWTITANGSVSGTIPGGGPIAEVTANGTVDQSLVTNWLTATTGLDLNALLVKLGPGPCRMAADGIDYQITAPLAGVSATSCEADLFADEPGLREAVALGNAAEAAAPLR